MTPSAEREPAPPAAETAEPFNPFPPEVVLEAARRFGTPHYLYDEATLEARCGALAETLPGDVHYAIKANSNLEILRIVRECGLNAEAVSEGEVHLALEAGFAPEEIVYTCHGASRREIEKIVRLGVPINADSLNQVEWICRAEHAPDDLRVRINQGVGAGHHERVTTGGDNSKFGITLDEVAEARAIAARYGKRVTGLHQHIGSNVLDAEQFAREAVHSLVVTSRYFTEVESLGFGGGLGVPYRPGEEPLDLARLGELLHGELDGAFRWRPVRPQLSFEPGRFPVAEAGVLNMTVTDRKTGVDGRTIVSLDAGFTHSPRAVLYGSYHHLVNASRPGAPTELAMVSDLICESGGRFTTADGDEAFQREVPRLEVGDVVSQLTAGAYVEAMASEFNTRAKPPAILRRRDGTLVPIG